MTQYFYALIFSISFISSTYAGSEGVLYRPGDFHRHLEQNKDFKEMVNERNKNLIRSHFETPTQVSSKNHAIRDQSIEEKIEEFKNQLIRYLGQYFYFFDALLHDRSAKALKGTPKDPTQVQDRTSSSPTSDSAHAKAFQPLMTPTGESTGTANGAAAAPGGDGDDPGQAGGTQAEEDDEESFWEKTKRFAKETYKKAKERVTGKVEIAPGVWVDKNIQVIRTHSIFARFNTVNLPPDVKTLDLSELSQLSTVSLNANSVDNSNRAQQIERVIWPRVNNIVDLYLAGDHIRSIDLRLFSSLRKVALSLPNLKTIQWPNENNHVKDLNFSNSGQISSIDLSMFSALEHLVLERNQGLSSVKLPQANSLLTIALHDLKSESFSVQGAVHLRRLFLDGNPDLQKLVLENLPRLTELKLPENLTGLYLSQDIITRSPALQAIQPQTPEAFAQALPHGHLELRDTVVINNRDNMTVGLVDADDEEGIFTNRALLLNAFGKQLETNPALKSQIPSKQEAVKMFQPRAKQLQMWLERKIAEAQTEHEKFKYQTAWRALRLLMGDASIERYRGSSLEAYQTWHYPETPNTLQLFVLLDRLIHRPLLLNLVSEYLLKNFSNEAAFHQFVRAFPQYAYFQNMEMLLAHDEHSGRPLSNVLLNYLLGENQDLATATRVVGQSLTREARQLIRRMHSQLENEIERINSSMSDGVDTHIVPFLFMIMRGHNNDLLAPYKAGKLAEFISFISGGLYYRGEPNRPACPDGAFLGVMMEVLNVLKAAPAINPFEIVSCDEPQ